MLRKNGVSASPTTTIADTNKVDTPMTLMKPPLNPDDAATWLRELLDAKLLEPFGQQKTQLIRQKFDENAMVWLNRLATSWDLQQVLRLSQ